MEDNIENNPGFTLSDSQKDIISNCSKLIFEENKGDIMIDNFNGIEVKIAYIVENNINLYYISFDVTPDYFEQFFNQYIEEWEKDIISPCHFVIPKLPTILIFNLLEKGPVILTGKRMGGIIASSLAFYLLYFSNKSFNMNYGNAFKIKKEKCLGVVTFGSPSFLTNSTAGSEMKKLTSYFYHIKEEFDLTPTIIDFINKSHHKYQNILQIFKNDKMTKEDKEKLIDYLVINNLTDVKLIKSINTFKKIPFGFYFMMKSSDKSLIFQNIKTFDDFYYLKLFNSSKISHLTIYKNLSSKIKFQKESLTLLENENNQLESIKIIRRNHKKFKENIFYSMKGIIKIKLSSFENNIITPDLISQIELISNDSRYNIKNDIYYDTNYITAYINNLNENINEITISNYFGGKSKINNIVNIQGSGSTKEMLKNNIEKLFIFPIFKLIEIFYDSLNNNEKYEKLKEENFGENFDILNKILKPFEMQIKTINELLFLSRPDIIGNSEKEFINKYIGNNLSNEQNNNLINNLETYYKKAKEIQNIQKILRD